MSCRDLFLKCSEWPELDAQQHGEGDVAQKAATATRAAAPTPAQRHKTHLQQDATGLPRPGSPPHRPNWKRSHSTQPSRIDHEVSVQLLNKELGKSSFCIKTKWRFSEFAMTSAPR